MYGGPSEKYLYKRYNEYFTRINNAKKKSIYAKDTKRLTELDKHRKLCSRYTKNGRMYGWSKMPEYERFNSIQKFYEKLREKYPNRKLLPEKHVKKITDNWNRVKQVYNPRINSRQAKEEQKKLNEQREKDFDLRINIKDPYIAKQHSKKRNSLQMFTCYGVKSRNRDNNNSVDITKESCNKNEIEYEIIK